MRASPYTLITALGSAIAHDHGYVMLGWVLFMLALWFLYDDYKKV